MRVCIDSRIIIVHVNVHNTLFPPLKRVLYRLSKAMVFSVLDAKDGFWQVKLEGKRSYLIPFWNPFWWYRMLLMAFGTCTPQHPRISKDGAYWRDEN